MKLYNPTEDVIENKFNGFIVIIGPGKDKSVSDDCGKHMMMKCGNLGLVAIEYGEKEEEKYGSYANFKKSMKKVGLTNYKNWVQQCLQQEQLFPREVSQKNGGEVESSTTRVPYFKNKLKEIESLMEEKEAAEVKTEEVAVPKKKLGRPRKVTNVNESATPSEG